MKILHAYKDFDPPIRGGIERHIALMCRHQREWAEVEVLVCARGTRTRRETVNGIPLTLAGEWGRFQGAPAAPTYPWLLRCARADVLVIHMPNPTTEIGCLLARPGGVWVARYHSDVVRQASAMKVYGWVQRQFLRQTDIILPTSSQYVETSPMLKPLETKCRVVPLGVPIEEFAAPDESVVRDLRERYGGHFVFFSGIHRYYKGLEWLVRAAPQIQSRVVIGGDGPERARCEALARELGTQIVFTGALSQPDLVAHLHACELLAFPSVERSEAFGLSVIEAHACGKPVVATRLGTGVEYANLDGVTGLNVPPRDSLALADAVNRLLADDALRVRLGAQARARVAAEFTDAQVARKEYDLYCEAVALRKTARDRA